MKYEAREFGKGQFRDYLHERAWLSELGFRVSQEKLVTKGHAFALMHNPQTGDQFRLEYDTEWTR